MAEARLYLDAVIQPTRSLPKRGLIVLLGVLVAVNLAIGAAFFLLGATPVPIFLGLDVAALSCAFWVSNRRAQGHERVRVSAEEVTVLREGRRGSSKLWASPTAFTRVGFDDSELRLMLSAKRLVIGQALGPAERAGLARSIDQAIRLARAERYE